VNGPAIHPAQEYPSDEDICQAVKCIDDVICDFPFVEAADKTNFIGYLLTPLLEGAGIGLKPLCIISKASPGTGSSFLAQSIAIIATGRRHPVQIPPDDASEWRKRITTNLMSGWSPVFTR
jgi:hypothetical protein